MRRFLIALLLGWGSLAALFSSPGCNGSAGGAANGPAPITTWTIIGYFMGRNENSQAANSLASQIETTKMTSSAEFEVAFSNIDFANAPFTTTRDIQVVNGTASNLADLGAASMINPNEMARYISAGITSARAQFHALVISGHNGGPGFALGADQVASVTTLDLAAFDNALTQAQQQSGLAQFDIVVLEMPESATLEAMAVLAKHAHYMVAVESGMPSSGVGYASISAALQANPAISATQLATTVAQSLQTACATNAPLEQGELAVVCIDLTQSAGVLTALNSLGLALAADVAAAPTAANTGAIAAIGSARRDAIESEIAFNTRVVDAKSFAAQLTAAAASIGGISTSSTGAAGTLVAAISTATVFASVGSDVLGAGGLGVFFPSNANGMPANFAQTAEALNASAPAWISFLQSYQAKLATGSQQPVVTFNGLAPTIVGGTSFTVTGVVTPVNTIQDVTLYISQPVPTAGGGTANVVVFAAPLAPPDVNGNVAYSGLAQFVSCDDAAALVSAIFVPFARQVRTQSPVYVFPADMQYTLNGTPSFAGGFVKVDAVAGITSGGLGAYAWTGQNSGTNNQSINDQCTTGGVVYTVFPRIVTISATGQLTASSQSGLGYGLGGAGIASLKINAATLPNPGQGTVWLVATGFDGEVGVVAQNVTLQ
jgi:hypothetical protein